MRWVVLTTVPYSRYTVLGGILQEGTGIGTTRYGTTRYGTTNQPTPQPKKMLLHDNYTTTDDNIPIQHRTFEHTTYNIRLQHYFNSVKCTVHLLIHTHNIMSASETASFTDPVFLATYGLNRITVLDYFLHPLNPFRTSAKSCNDLLVEQQISIGFIMQNGIGMRPGPMSLTQAEEEFTLALSREKGEQYELLPCDDPEAAINSPLFTIRHVYRSDITKITPLGIYYVLEGVVYKAPSARSLMKANVTRTCQGLIDACDELKKCARFTPRTGYYFDFDSKSSKARETSGNQVLETDSEILEDFKKRVKIARTSRRVLDNRPMGEKSEEEGIRAKEKINSILFRMQASLAKV